MASKDTARSIPKSSILRQFLTPVLLAVLITGLSISLVSKWAAERSSRMASAMRMSNIGQIIAQSSYPKTANVLENLKSLTRLEFMLLRWDPAKKLAVVEQATLKVPPPTLLRIGETLEQGVVKVEPKSAKPASIAALSIHEIQIDALTMRWTAFPADSRWFVVLEPENVRGDSWFYFALPLVTGLLSSLAIAVVAAWTAKRFSNRIEYLEKEVSEIAVGKFSPKTILGPDDAIRSLHTSLYSMGEQLEVSKRQIEINERTRLIHMIGSGLAHELRNHLAGARLALQTVEVNEDDLEAIDVCLKQLDLAETQIRRLLAIRPGGASIDSIPHSVRDIKESVLSFALPIAQHQQVQLDVFSSPDAAKSESVSIDDALVCSGASVVGIILNVVLNGIEAVSSDTKSTGQMKRVEVITQWLPATVTNSDSEASCGTDIQATDSFTRQRNPHKEEVIGDGIFCAGDSRIGTAGRDAYTKVQWIVRDTGPGPSLSMSQCMFEPFATTKREGVGLGLAMCKQVIEAIGGSIQWKRENDVTQFEIVTPIHQAGIHLAGIHQAGIHRAGTHQADSDSPQI